MEFKSKRIWYRWKTGETYVGGKPHDINISETIIEILPFGLWSKEERIDYSGAAYELASHEISNADSPLHTVFAGYEIRFQSGRLIHCHNETLKHRLKEVNPQIGDKLYFQVKTAKAKLRTYEYLSFTTKAPIICYQEYLDADYHEIMKSEVALDNWKILEGAPER